MSRSRKSERTGTGTLAGRVEQVSLDRVVPYWRNPRVISEEAVQAVAESLRSYGYQQPIVVDDEYVIVAGHTRYSAMRRLGVTEAPVLVTDLPPDKVKQLRVLDNRVKEFTSWDFDALVAELGDLDSGLAQAYFPQVGSIHDDGGTVVVDAADLTGDEVVEVDTEAEFVCPSCFHTWAMSVNVDDVKKGRLEVTHAPA